jgi:hypothetical protein
MSLEMGKDAVGKGVCRGPSTYRTHGGRPGLLPGDGKRRLGKSGGERGSGRALKLSRTRLSRDFRGIASGFTMRFAFREVRWLCIERGNSCRHDGTGSGSGTAGMAPPAAIVPFIPVCDVRTFTYKSCPPVHKSSRMIGLPVQIRERMLHFVTYSPT